jgi:NADH dehydrogenase [ubiquinone] 1 alpha subcomplex assembly factor 5
MIPTVFDRRALRRQRERRAGDLGGVDFLLREVAGRLVERLDEIRRPLEVVLDLGCHGGQLGRALGERAPALVSAELSERQVRGAPGLRVVADAEALPFRDGCFDAVVSALDLHWVNDLPGALVQVRRALKPDGVMLAAMLGGATLHELRESLTAAELEVRGGAAPRVSPFTDLRDAGGLLQRAGFALPMVDLDRITVTYESPLVLIDEIRRMGEAAVPAERPPPLTRGVLLRAAEIHAARFADARGRVPATFDVLFLTGWAPHGSQPRPALRGSAGAGLARLLDEARAGGSGPRPSARSRKP